VDNSVAAYHNAIWLAIARFFHEAFEENHRYLINAWATYLGTFSLRVKSASL
jgi:hypothetical protein